MKPLRINHLYGHALIQSAECPACRERAFVIGGKMSCCGLYLGKQGADSLKVEVDKVGARRKLPPAWMRKEILKDQNNQCFYCDAQFGSWRTIDGEPKLVKLAWDHVLPFSYDGNNHEFVASCSRCNLIKADKIFSTPTEAKTHIQIEIHEKEERVRTNRLFELQRRIQTQEKMAEILQQAVPIRPLEREAPKSAYKRCKWMFPKDPVNSPLSYFPVDKK